MATGSGWPGGPIFAKTPMSKRSRASAPLGAAAITNAASAAAAPSNRIAPDDASTAGAARLPGVDEAVAVRRLLRQRRRGQRRRDPTARLGGVDDVVDLEQLRRVQRLGVLLRGRRHLADALLPRLLLLDRLELPAERQADRALEAHRTQVRARPGHRQQRLVQAACGHG